MPKFIEPPGGDHEPEHLILFLNRHHHIMKLAELMLGDSECYAIDYLLATLPIVKDTLG